MLVNYYIASAYFVIHQLMFRCLLSQKNLKKRPNTLKRPKMADDEQFSLCWNNFNTNLSAGFHESLCRGDLVDVTLAAEGQLVKAHRLVLSVCSPYFRKMFTQMPANQHAFGKFDECTTTKQSLQCFFSPFSVSERCQLVSTQRLDSIHVLRRSECQTRSLTSLHQHC